MSLSLLLVFEETCRLYCKVVAFILILFFLREGTLSTRETLYKISLSWGRMCCVLQVKDTNDLSITLREVLNEKKKHSTVLSYFFPEVD